MRAIILILAAAVISGCSSPQTIKVEARPSGKAITTLDNEAVVYDRSSVAEIQIEDNAENGPKLVSKVNPQYPEIALRAGLMGNVRVRALIAPSGQVRTATILETDAEIFNESALVAALKWTFEPTVVDGKPVAVWVKIPFRFALSKR